MLDIFMDTGHVFLSYARHDGWQMAEQIEKDLIAAGYPTWRDRRNLNEYADFSAEIEMGIRAARCVAVCITPSVEQNPGSFVRREIIYAQSKQKPIIPLVFPEADVPVLINHLTWIPFFEGHSLNYEAGFQQFLMRLRDLPDQMAGIKNEHDPFRDYLISLYEWIIAYLDKTVLSLIPLASEAQPDAVQSPEQNSLPLTFLSAFSASAGIQAPSTRHYSTFADAFTAYQGRMLLLGEPGGGKTTTLMMFARDMIVRRLADMDEPLPIIAPISSWDAYRQPAIVTWLAEAIPSLKNEVNQIINSGQAILFLDGLDELGSERLLNPDNPDGEKFDPRPRFIQLLPTQNQILLTCREQDYRQLGEKVPLNGAVRLNKLSDMQIKDYLQHQQAIWDILQRDEQLRQVARVPLLLSLIAYTFAESSDTLIDLEQMSAFELRDKIFSTYLERRYQHEQRKPFAVLPYTYEKMLRVLRCMARLDVEAESQNVIQPLYPAHCLGYEPDTFIEQCLQLHLLIPEINNANFQFIHLLLRDHLAFPDLLRSLGHQDGWRRRKAVNGLGEMGDPRAIEAISNILLHDKDENVRNAAAEALGNMPDPASIPALITALEDERARVRASAAITLGKIGDARSIAPLIALAHDGDKAIQQIALAAAQQIHDPAAISTLINTFNDAKSEIAYVASNTLMQFGTIVIPPLIEALQHPDTKVRYWAIRTLGALKAEAAVPALILLLQDKTSVSFLEQICDVAAEKLEDIGSQVALQAVEAWKQSK